MQYTLTDKDFIIETIPPYSDPEGNAPLKIKIVALPLVGVLEYEGTSVLENQIFDYITDIKGGKIKYITDSNTLESYSDYFKFKASDIGSKLFSNIGTISITVPRQFNPPSVDDNSAPLTDKIYTFKVEDFTLGYSDIDGDGYSTITLEKLTGVEGLELIGSNAIIGDTFEVINTSNLKFVLPDNYAIYDGILYKYSRSLNEIILEYEAADFKLIENEGGTLTFGKKGGSYDTKILEGIVMPNESLCLDFTIQDNSVHKSRSNIAKFCLIPEGNVNVKRVYINEPPTVGDNEFTI